MRDPLLVLVCCAFTSQVAVAVMMRLDDGTRTMKKDGREGEAGMRDGRKGKSCFGRCDNTVVNPQPFRCEGKQRQRKNRSLSTN